MYPNTSLYIQFSFIQNQFIYKINSLKSIIVIAEQNIRQNIHERNLRNLEHRDTD